MGRDWEVDSVLDMVIRNAHIWDTVDQSTDIGICDGTIVEIGRVKTSARRQVDVHGSLVLPPFVESHIHLDTVMTAGNPRWNDSGTLAEGIEIWSERRASLSPEDVVARAKSVIQRQIAYGILYVRAHVDVSDPALIALRALVQLRSELRPVVDIQLVAFPQSGLATPELIRRMEEALSLGADAASAVPHLESSDEQGVESLRTCFRLAQKYNRLVHVFCDENDDGDSRFIEHVAHLAIASGLRHKVAASHVNAMAHYPPEYLAQLLPALVDSGINIVSCPLVSCAMLGRQDDYPQGRGITRIRDLWRAGVNVSLGHDDILTPFYPFGTGNMLRAANMAAHLAHMTGTAEVDELVRMITLRGARTLGRSAGYGVQVGNKANLIVLDAIDSMDLVRRAPASRYVVRDGRVVAESYGPRAQVTARGMEADVSLW